MHIGGPGNAFVIPAYGKVCQRTFSGGGSRHGFVWNVTNVTSDERCANVPTSSQGSLLPDPLSPRPSNNMSPSLLIPRRRLEME